MKLATVHQLPNESFSVEGRELLLIPEGNYALRFQSFATANMFGSGRLIMRFRIAEGAHNGKVLERYYPVKTVGKVGKKGGFSVTKRSRFLREFVTVTGHLPDRLDRVPITRLRAFLVTAKVETVCKDYEGFEIPKVLQYSKIGRLLSGAVAT